MTTPDEIRAMRDRLRIDPEFNAHDDLCESIDVDIGVGVQSSPCACYERANRRLYADQFTGDAPLLVEAERALRAMAGGQERDLGYRRVIIVEVPDAE